MPYFLRTFLNSPYLFWALLALPALGMITGVSKGADPERLLHPSGEFAARFMIIAMLISPLQLLFPGRRWLQWLMARRRYLGVAAFGYALLHTVLYFMARDTLDAVLAEALELGLWTGWLAFFIFVPLAATSNNASMRALRHRWKPLQRWVYAAAVLTLAHWLFVKYQFGPAIVHFAPLVLLEAWRVFKLRSRALQAAAH